MSRSSTPVVTLINVIDHRYERFTSEVVELSFGPCRFVPCALELALPKPASELEAEYEHGRDDR
jgi:hypothetical protein